ncbi:N-acetylglucosamine-6-phosphate deacetylase [Spiroplasma sabaudiense Ar-1343]|uniref:N-acetylglucosamine-6-phosphate deacetylase n=1 Tax=Spiroplasma sabaudiense Ar-1343 TaxID=1276257 RepID=W6AJM9_9MOLU|nr:N-acetylglucosamine-6-phosphate deacetylase [Spiroplasma sabaudiense]AHI53934.1 N-acetylglucosamine-6-phosphate deacetylase [Spiroplasma sabaudiense Ar-1343]
MLFKNAKIVLENQIIELGFLKVEGTKITKIGEGKCDEPGIDLQGSWILPGFIDVHVHGGYGTDFETGTVAGYNNFAQKVAQEGITKYLQAAVTNSIADNQKILKEFSNFMSQQNGLSQSRCLGAHLEGPFISPERKGAHELKLLMAPNIGIMEELVKLANNTIRMVTYASDLQDGEFTKFLLSQNIIPSAGHSNMRASQFEADYQIGIRHITHLFNGMSGVSQHEPGLATAALLHDDVVVEVITDGIHIQPETLKLIYKIKGPNGIIVITDAMNAKGLPDGDYKLGGLEVEKEGIKVVLKGTSTLAGAGATYDYNVRFFLKTCGFSMTDLIKMTSINAAKQLQIFDQTGSIALNKLADLVILDKDLKVVKTISEGKIVFGE